MAGLVVVGLLVRSLGAGSIARYVSAVGPGFVLLPAACFAANVLYALPLGLLLPRGARLAIGRLLKGRLAAISVNAATPLFGVGGEPVRLLWLPRAQQRPGVAALFVDRGAFFVASALFLVGGALLATFRLPLPRAALVVVLVVSGLGLALAGALWLLQRRGAVAAPLARLASLVARGHRDRIASRAAEIDDHIRALHLDRPRRFTAAVSLHFGGRLLSVAEVALAAWLLGLHVGFAGALLLTALPLAVDLAFSVVPSQIGLHEGATALIAHALGIDPAAGVALAFLQRMRQVLFVAAGFLLLTLARPTESVEPEAAPAQPSVTKR